MSSISIFWPVLAQVFLTLVMFMVLGARKARVIRAGTVNRAEAALDNRVWPDNVVKVSNNIANQFEVPVLFYVVCFVTYLAGGAGTAELILAWVFVISRYAHAYVHIGSNYVPIRLKLFMLGCFTVLAMLVMVAWELAAGGPVA